MINKADIWSGLALLVFCVVMFLAGLELPRAPYGTMGPEFMPNLVLILLAALSLALIIRGFLFPASASSIALAPLPTVLLKYRNVFFSFLLFFLFAWLLPVLGYVITSFSFLFILQFLLGPKTWGKAGIYAIVAIGMTLILFLMFRCMLLVILPEADFDLLRSFEDVVNGLVCGPWELILGKWL